jgi:putative ABC transport system permease protein
MRLLSPLRTFVDFVFHRQRIEREMDEEFRSHLEIRAEDLKRQGLPPAEAERQARIEFGGYHRYKEECRETLGTRLLQELAQDVRYGLRQLRRNPGFTVVAVLTLALGIGANTAIFSVVDGVLLTPLPYGQPDRLVAVWQWNPRLKHEVFDSYPNFRDWQRDSRSFEQMAAVAWKGFDVTSPGAPEHVNGRHVTASFFGTLGVRLALGRGFSAQEDQHGGAPVVVISNRLWRNRFGSSAYALGKIVRLDGVDYSIVGVLPAGFRFYSAAEVYTPLGQGDPVLLSNRAIHPGILAIARLKPGLSISQANAEMGTVQENLDKLYPDANRGLGAEVIPLKQFMVGDAGGPLLLLWGAVGLLLLIACANVANLLLARSAVRIREFVLRSALGASRRRVMRQLVTESMLLSLAGGGLGLLIAASGVKPMLAALPGDLPRSNDIHLDVLVLVFAFGAAVAVGVLFGLAAALKNSLPNLPDGLKEGGRTSSGNRGHAQNTLVILQVALTLILLVSAGLLFRTIRRLWGTDPGFQTQHLITFKVGLSTELAKAPSGTKIAYRQLVERIRQIPGVQAADLTNLVPLSRTDNLSPFWLGSQHAVSYQEAPRLNLFWTGPDYRQTMGIPLLRGGFFDAEDTNNSTPVIVVDSVLAHAYFPGKNPVGRSISIANWRSALVIGVVGHVRNWGLGKVSEFPRSEAYASLNQLPDQWVRTFYGNLTVLVRTPLVASAVMPAIKRAVYGTGRPQTVYDVRTMQDIVSGSMSSQRFPMVLLAVFAGLALLLASVGIYGVISYSVTRRTHEIGIRMALGAERKDVLRMVVGQGLRLALTGVAIGIAGALALTRFLVSLLYGVKPTDPLTFIAVSLILVAVALAACYIPARRAAKVDPMAALRYE